MLIKCRSVQIHTGTSSNHNLTRTRTGVPEVVKLRIMDLGQAEQLCSLSVHMYSCLDSTVQLPGTSLASVEVLLTLEKYGTDRQTNRHTAVFVESNYWSISRLIPMIKLILSNCKQNLNLSLNSYPIFQVILSILSLSLGFIS